MFLKIKTPNDAAIKAGDSIWIEKMHSRVQTLSHVEEVIPELTEKEKLLSKIFGLNITQGEKEALAQIVNKVYE